MILREPLPSPNNWKKFPWHGQNRTAPFRDHPQSFSTVFINALDIAVDQTLVMTINREGIVEKIEFHQAARDSTQPYNRIVFTVDAVETAEFFSLRRGQLDGLKMVRAPVPANQCLIGIAGKPHIAFPVFSHIDRVPQGVCSRIATGEISKAVMAVIKIAKTLASSKPHPGQPVAIGKLGGNGNGIEYRRLTGPRRKMAAFMR